MQEKLITLKTAVLANEKGYTNSNNKIGLYTEDNKYHPCMAHWLMDYTEFYLAPTQTLLQKWLREVHNIDVFVTRVAVFQNRNLYSYGVIKNIDLCLDAESYVTYEEALENGLQEALKLIINPLPSLDAGN